MTDRNWIQSAGVLPWLMAALAVWNCAETTALDGRKLTSQYTVHDWSTERGLPDNCVQAISQDSGGHLLLGTLNHGFTRFDGARFSAWTPDAAWLTNDWSVRALCAGRDGSVWAGADGAGLWRFFGKDTFHYSKEDGLANESVRALYEDRTGRIWIGLAGPGVAQWVNGKIVPMPVPEDGPVAIVDFFEDQRGGVWLAGEGLWYFENGQFINMQKKLGLRPQRFTGVREDAVGCVWIATMRGLLRVEGDYVTTFLEVDGVSDDQVRALHVDRDGNLWIGTNSGLDRYRDGKFSRCLTREQLPFDRVYSIFEDREGSLWIGTSGGLTRLRDDKFSNLTTRDGLLQNLIAAVVEGRDGSLWVATRTRGVARLKDRIATIYDKETGLPRDTMRCIHEDRNGVIWAGTERGGLSRISDDGTVTFGRDGEFRGRRVFAIQDDPEGHLWVLANDGSLFRFQNGQFTRVAPENGVVGGKVDAIHLGRGGSFWAATENGLNRRRHSRWEACAFPDSLHNKTARSIYEDRDGNVWLCLVSEGLVRFRDGRFTRYRARQGLLDDSPHAVLEDHRNQLWISGRHGIFRIDKSDFDRLDRGEIPVLSGVCFNEADGMNSRRCSRIGFPLATQLRDGRLCFPTDQGIAMVDPDNLPSNLVTPRAWIEAVVLDHRRMPPDQIHSIPAGTRDVELHFSAVSLRGTDKVEFKYKLEGFDEDWIGADDRRLAHYQNLEPGEYQFRVLAANEDGVWHPEPAVYGFVKKAFFFQTAWFEGFCGLVITLSAALIHRKRIDRTRKECAALLEERTRIARDLHDTLEQGLVGISMQLSLAGAKFSQSPTTARKHLEKARYMLRLSMADARAAISNLRHDGTPEKDLAAEFKRMAENLSLGHAVEFSLETHGERFVLSPFAAETLLRIGQEALTNVMKHAQASSVRIDLSFEALRLHVRIEDDGRGFDVSTARGRNEESFGLLGMRERVEKLGGDLAIDSSPGHGTTVEFAVPRSRALGGD